MNFSEFPDEVGELLSDRDFDVAMNSDISFSGRPLGLGWELVFANPEQVLFSMSSNAQN